MFKPPNKVILADALRKASLEMPPPQKEAWGWRSPGQACVTPQSMAGVGRGVGVVSEALTALAM